MHQPHNPAMTATALSKNPSGHPAVADCILPLRMGRDAGLICVPGITGQAVEYATFASRMPERFCVYGVRATPFILGQLECTSLQSMVARYATQLLDIGAPRPWVIVGFCFGGLVALELASQLATRGAPPTLLVLIDTFFVRGSGVDFADDERQQTLWGYFTAAFVSRAAAAALGNQQEFWGLSRQEKFGYIAALCRSSDALLFGSEVRPAEVERCFLAFSSYAEALKSLMPTPYAGRVLAVGTARSELSVRKNLMGDSLTGPVTFLTFEASHLDFLHGELAFEIGAGIEVDYAAAECYG